MTAQVCKRCGDYMATGTMGHCKRKQKQTSPWQDWCKEKRSDWENWRLGNGGDK